MAKTNYSEETKAAVMAALLAGQSVTSVSKKYSIPKGTVSGWNKTLVPIRTEATQKKGDIGSKLVALVETEIDTLIQISEVTRDPKWIRLQTAADLAVFTGVKADKLIRLLEAFGANDSDTDAEN